MTEVEYWIGVDKKLDSLINEFKIRYERSIDPEFIHESVLEEIRLLWEFTNFCIGNDLRGKPVYDGGRLRFAKLELQNGSRDFDNSKHLELDAYLKFEKWLQGDEIGVEVHHLGNTFKEQIKRISTGEKLRRYLLQDDLNKFFKEVQVVFSTLPYEINKSKEGYFHSHIHLILIILGFDITSEVSTNIGRIDAVIELRNIIYIMEFKIGNTTKAVLQIERQKYFQKYQTSKKEIKLVGVACSTKERNIVDWTVKTIQNKMA